MTMTFASAIARCTVIGIFSILGELMLLADLGYAQSHRGDSSPTLSETFSFRLSPRRDEAINQIMEAINKHYEFQRTREFENANKDIFSRATDLLRFVPFRLSNSSGNIDDFFTPNYLRSDHVAPPDAHLFDGKRTL
jgi:hypothetical protein